ncbi:Uu.00g140470.m01.CDS01 [Anthostomella pinea]|uniref:Uu.00g140470.m01.CDS01 n=1 Tax=Anthostomella pinea TaxID=933095 RepID=A0AAI8VQ74_9PEZI|nr:Uu.00g140470.m01.CDS01 [Anthostomella pinea]
MSFRRVTAAAILALATFAFADNLEVAAQTPTLGSDTVHGCYSDIGPLKFDSKPDFNSQGACVKVCRDEKKHAVAATYADSCFCGDSYPPKSALVDDSKCNEPCPGYDTQACGGLGTWTVYNTGLLVAVADAAVSSSSTTSAAQTTSATTAASSTADTVQTVTASSEPETDSNSKSSGSKTNTAGIAAGVVVGVVVIAAIAGGMFFWMRRKRNSELEEEHRRNAAVNAFISGGKPPSSSGGLSMADSRMDPVMNRRGSDGSIADNQDYSRRILRVTNA